MIPAAFDYHRASSLEGAAKLLAQHAGDAKLLAGGHSLIPMMKLRLAQPGVVVDIGGLVELSYIKRHRKHIALGALTTHASLAASTELGKSHRALVEAAGAIGDVQVRNCGTIGGSLAHADPAADYPAVVIAFEGEVVVKGATGARTIPAFKFFTGPLSTALAPDEIVTEVRLPTFADSGSAYEKFAQPASGFAVAGVCAVVQLDKAGSCRQVRFAATGVTDRPTRLAAVETALKGAPWNVHTVRAACERADSDIKHVLEDAYASADYRRHLLRVVARRAAERAMPLSQS